MVYLDENTNVLMAMIELSWVLITCYRFFTQILRVLPNIQIILLQMVFSVGAIADC